MQAIDDLFYESDHKDSKPAFKELKAANPSTAKFVASDVSEMEIEVKVGDNQVYSDEWKDDPIAEKASIQLKKPKTTTNENKLQENLKKIPEKDMKEAKSQATQSLFEPRPKIKKVKPIYKYLNQGGIIKKV